jgi:S-layer family protein
MTGGTLAWALDLEACDTSVTTEAVARLWACAEAPGSCTIVGEARSGIAEAPGCRKFFASLPYPYLQVRNWNFMYFVDVFGTDGTNNVPVDFRSVRFGSLRQVSPPPAVATFDDVPPSHPFFRHIEALAEARISGGCGNGRYCPDRPLTRGEMAVLLAEALGINFFE